MRAQRLTGSICPVWRRGALLLSVVTSGCLYQGPKPADEAESTNQIERAAYPETEASPSAAAEWHRWRGADFDGITSETNWTHDWPDGRPTEVWKASVGTGFSSMSVREGRLYTMGHKQGNDIVFCLDTETGEEIWRFKYAAPLHAKFYEGGPSATPTLHADVVYTFGKAGDLYCLNAKTGEVIWGKNLQEKLGLTSPTWGFAGSPLVQEDLVIVNAGQYGTALNKKTGEIAWTTGQAASGYASPVPFTLNDQKAIAIFASESIAVVSLENGELLARHPWDTSNDVNAADPIIQGNKIFISSGYGKGCALIEINNGSTKEVWRHKKMRNHFSTSLLMDGHLYGIDGQARDRRPELKCLDFKTGKVLWSQSIFGTGTLIGAGDRLIVLSGKGQLIIAEASPQRFRRLAQAQVLGGRCWISPLLNDGRLYCRNAEGNLVCLDLSR